MNHIIVPVGQKGQSTVVTVSKNNPKYSSVGTPISNQSARDASIWSDRKFGKDGLNSFIVNSDGKYLDL